MGPLWTDNIGTYKNKYDLEKLLKNYWRVHIEDIGEISTRIEAGSRLWISKQEIIRSCIRDRRARSGENEF